jgi:hypothetical protein
MKRYQIALVLSALILTTLACGVGGPVTRRNSDVRRAALAYELSTRGTVDEVLVAFGMTEVRDNLGFEDGNTVWLNRFAEGDYFRKRDPNQSYLFLHDLDYDDGAASIAVDRGDASGGVASHTLILQREEDTWVVVSDDALEPSSSPPD